MACAVPQHIQEYIMSDATLIALSDAFYTAMFDVMYDGYYEGIDVLLMGCEKA